VADSVFHRGELEVQRRAGVARMASRIGGSIHTDIPPVAEEFLAQRRWVVLSTTDAEGRPWASILNGAPGFVSVGPGSLHLEASPTPGDPLEANLRTSEFAGLLAIDLATRRRMRVNARLDREHRDGILLYIDQVYSNCPKYIQRRVEKPGSVTSRKLARKISTGLSEAQRGWIASADTFFIGTTNPGEGADASHRGGRPGFVRVEGNRISWPEYQGNMMFNTLGNIHQYPRAGLIFPDFIRGRTLQLTGKAAINWNSVAAAGIAGAEQVVELDIEQVVQVDGALPGQFVLLDSSPHLPPSS
jgi:predicted pyridoxine 5'-phosphate oxidase superfamily flavin-nucleotide-binding protein